MCDYCHDVMTSGIHVVAIDSGLDFGTASGLYYI